MLDCSQKDMTVVVAARNPDKPVLKTLAEEYGVITHACDASDSDSVTALFGRVKTEHGTPNLVVHNIDGRMREIFRKRITEAEPKYFTQTVLNSTVSAFLVGQQAAIGMLENPVQEMVAAPLFLTPAQLKGFPLSGAFATACHGKAGLAESMARELMQGIHVASVPIDAAIGWTQEDGSRAHWAAGKTEEDNMADPDFIAETYLQIHRQHRSTWTHEVILRPWVEKW